MPTDEIRTTISRMQDRLANAKKAGDTPTEIDVLLSIAQICFDNEDLSGANMHFKLAEKIMRRSGRIYRLHEALGGQGRVLRRGQRIDEALARFREAQAAAAENDLDFETARWKLCTASALRDQGDTDGARTAIEEAEALLRPERRGPLSFLGGVNFGDPNQVSLLAELEGQIGLTAMADDDPDGAEEAYRNAVYLAENADNPQALNTWATNLGNAYSRRRLYTEALQQYEAAAAAALKPLRPRSLAHTAAQMAVCYLQAYRHSEGAGRLEALVDEAGDRRAELAILDNVMALYDQALELQKFIEVATRAQEAARALAFDPKYVDRLQARIERVRSYLENPPSPQDQGPTALDVHLPRTMSQAVKGNLEAAREAAHLVCDIRLGLLLAGGDRWKKLTDGTLLSQPGLDLRVLSDAVGMLVEKERSGAALDLLQRYKAAGFALPSLARFRKTGAPGPEAEDYLAAADALRDRVAKLGGPAQPDFLGDLHAVRRAGEALLECGERLREKDPILCARMGGVVRKEELIDALPLADPVAVVDFLVGIESTAGVILYRTADRVQAVPFKNEVFNTAEVGPLLDIYAAADLPAGKPGPQQAEALQAIGKILHDRLLCSLTRDLSSRGITQMVLVPDMLTRFLPLHLSLICGEEIEVPGVDTAGARYLCEVMPVEYAPCLQAVAASQIYRRPKAVSTVAAFADPGGDLPAVRQVLAGLAERLADTVEYRFHCGDQAGFDAVNQSLSDADVLLFGAHGKFMPADPERSHLMLADRPWAVSDVIDRSELVRNPVLVLAACQVGAVAVTPDDREAYGISGALIASGAATVLANLWEVEEVSMSYLLERFLHHLAHPGYRPAAALFRAVRDMRRLPREEVLVLFRRHIERLEESRAEDRVIISAENQMEKIEDQELEFPFADPVYWGATVVVGSGWHLPAGAYVGGPLDGVNLTLKQGEIDALIQKGEYRSAQRLARELAGAGDGVFRARALVAQAHAVLKAADIGSAQAARRTAAGLLLQAERTARAEEDDALLEQIESLKPYLEQ